MSTPVQRITKLLDEGARLKAELPGQMSIDLTSDVIAALTEVQSRHGAFEPGKESIPRHSVGRDVRTGVHFP